MMKRKNGNGPIAPRLRPGVNTAFPNSSGKIGAGAKETTMAKSTKGPRRPKLRAVVTVARPVVRAAPARPNVVHHVHHAAPSMLAMRPRTGRAMAPMLRPPVPLVRAPIAPPVTRPPVAPTMAPPRPMGAPFATPPVVGGAGMAPIAPPVGPIAPRAPLPGPMGPMRPPLRRY